MRQIWVFSVFWHFRFSWEKIHGTRQEARTRKVRQRSRLFFVFSFFDFFFRFNGSTLRNDEQGSKEKRQSKKKHIQGTWKNDADCGPYSKIGVINHANEEGMNDAESLSAAARWFGLVSPSPASLDVRPQARSISHDDRKEGDTGKEKARER